MWVRGITSKSMNIVKVEQIIGYEGGTSHGNIKSFS